MKKVFITLVAFLAISSTVMAAGHVDSVRYLTTKAWKNWFISADGNIDWWMGSDRNPNGHYRAVQWGKPDFGASISVGKWINHKMGVRLTYNANGGKVWLNKNISGPNSGDYWMFDLENGIHDDYGYYNVKFINHYLHGEVFFSPIDFFQGYYNPERIWTPVVYAGMGISCVTDKIFVVNSKHRNFEPSAGVGLINNFRLGKHFDLNLNLRYTIARWTIDSWHYESDAWFYSDGSIAGLSYDENGIASPLPHPETGENPTYIRPFVFDQNFTVGLGLTYYFSREYDLPKDCCAEMDSIKKKLDEFVCPPIPVPVHDTIVKFVNVQSEDILSYPFSIFFNRDSYQLMSRRDIVNLREIAKVAKENGYKLRLTGSCDSATATPSYNQTLSENRCNKIKIELLELGIPESQIIIEPIGGVKQLDPTEYDRRVLIQLVKEAE